MQAGRPPRLGQEHGAELARADQRHADLDCPVAARAASNPAEIHRHSPRTTPDRAYSAAASPVRQSSGRQSIGAKSRWAIHSGRWNRRIWFSTWQALI